MTTTPVHPTVIDSPDDFFKRHPLTAAVVLWLAVCCALALLALGLALVSWALWLFAAALVGFSVPAFSHFLLWSAIAVLLFTSVEGW